MGLAARFEKRSGECGDSPSAIFSFTTETTTQATEIGGNSFQLYPNPAKEAVRLSFSQPIEEALQIDWLSANGQRIKTETMGAQAQELGMDISNLPDGLYLVRMSSLQESVSRRILIKH